MEQTIVLGDALDPFVGIGATAVACVKSSREFIGFEIDEEYYPIAQGRLNKLRHKMGVNK